jgi:hypothetical protein
LQGIDPILQGNANLIRQYSTTRGGRLRTIQPVHIRKDDDKVAIRKILTSAMKNDLAAAFCIIGDRADYLARDGRMDVAGTAIEVAGELGITLGIGGRFRMYTLALPIREYSHGFSVAAKRRALILVPPCVRIVGRRCPRRGLRKCSVFGEPMCREWNRCFRRRAR